MNPMITLYTDSSPNGFKITIALEELGLTYHLRHIKIDQGENRSPAFLRLNPHGRIPVLVDASNGITLFLNGSMLNPPGEITSLGGATTNWMSHTVNFTASAGDTIMFAATGLSDSYGGYLDNITISAVPEPATMSTLLIALACFGGRFVRRAAAGV